MWKRILVLIGVITICPWRAAAESAPRMQWVVVVAPAFKMELTPLLKQRRAEGFDVKVVETVKILSPEQIRQGDVSLLQARLSDLCHRHNGPTYILLAGADAANDPFAADNIVVPTLPGTIGRMNGKPSDHGYGLPDANGSGTVAVGRFPARSPEEFRAMVRKTLSIENASDADPWRNRLVLLLGDSGGGAIGAAVVEQAVNSRLARLAPEWSLDATFSAGSSRYCLPSSQVHDSMIHTLAQGDLFSIFLGHSTASGMWLTGPNFLTESDWAALRIAQGPGVFFTCGCFACQPDGSNSQAYALAAIRNPGGPAAVIGPTGESWSAPGLLAVDGLMSCCTNAPFPSRLGDYWLAVQAGLAKGRIDEGTFKMYDQFDGTQGKVPLSVQRLEHLEMWTLLGDPAMRLPLLREDITLEVPDPASPGTSLSVNGALPRRLKGAAVRITLERALGARPADLEKLPPDSPENRAERERVAVGNHRRANDVVLSAADAKVSGSRFSCPLEVPASLPWSNLVIRAVAAKNHETGMGLLKLTVAR
jgi:hypothetical protein